MTTIIMKRPVRDVETQVMLNNRDAVRYATDINSVKLPSKDETIKIFGDVK